MTLPPFLLHRDLPAVCFCLYLVCHSNSNDINSSNNSSSISIIKTSHRFCCFCWKMTLQIFVIEARKTTIDIQSCGFISSIQGFQCIHNMKSTCAIAHFPHLIYLTWTILNTTIDWRWITRTKRMNEKEEKKYQEKLWAFMYIQSENLNAECWMLMRMP